MGLTIDDSIRYIKGLRDAGGCGYQQANIAISTMRKYQNLADENKQLSASITMMKADYNARLKADMAAMLTEIQLECEENTMRWYVGRVDGKSDDVVLMETLNEIIQQKINSLKGEQE